jgi:putative MFS transporter
VKRQALAVGVLSVCVGVALHVPDYLAVRHQHFMMAGMGLDVGMTVGMVLIVAGLTIAAWGLLPENAFRSPPVVPGSVDRFEALETTRMGRAHWTLALVLTVGLVIDTMKPATLGFVIPDMAEEYDVPVHTASLLTFVALCGTVLGSLVWGRLADQCGRRSMILLSSLMYIGTSICGFMPSLGWNLVMCFLMGSAAGGMLPTVYSLTSESMPARHRGWILVLMTGVGASLGYVVASGMATVIEPTLSWRAMWLLNAPTGLLLLLLCRWIPESPRFLALTGQMDEARRVMRRYGIVTASVAAAAVPTATLTRQRFGTLLVGQYKQRTLAVVFYGLGWGVANWGFVTFLPTYLTWAGMGEEANRLLFASSLLALPGVAVAGLLYARWGGKRSMLLYSATTAVVLAAFAATRPADPKLATPFILLTTVLLLSANGMVAMLSPYAAEIFPTTLRASGSGIAAAATKAGGMFGPLLLTSAPGIGTLAVISMVPVAVAVTALWQFGPETSPTAPLADVAVERVPSR